MRNSKYQRTYESMPADAVQSTKYPGIWCSPTITDKFWAIDEDFGWSYVLSAYFNKPSKKWKISKGYWRVRYNGRLYLAHLILGYQFIPGFKPGYVIDHINNDSTDNSIANLQWVSRAHNTEKYWNVDVTPEKKQQHVDALIAGCKAGHAAGHYKEHLDKLHASMRRK